MPGVPLDRRTVLRLGLLSLGAACTPDSSPGTPRAGTSPISPAPDASTGPPPTTSGSAPSTPAAAPRPVPLLCRDAWGAREATPGATPHRIERITVHHSAVVADDPRRGPARMREYQAFHMGERGWSDVAYHLGIDRGGHVYALRPWDRVGATATAYDPTGHLLVLVDGHFGQQEPSTAQRGVLVDVLAWAADHFDVGLDTVTGHRDHAVTPCPGDALYDRLGGLLHRAAARRQDGGVRLVERCGPDGRDAVAAIEAGDTTA